MYILDLAVLHPDLVAVRHVAQRVERTQHVHGPDRLVNHVPPHRVGLGAPAARQRRATGPGQLRALDALAVGAPGDRVGGVLVGPHVEVGVANLLQHGAGRLGGRGEGRPGLGLDVPQRLCCIEKERARRGSNRVNHRDDGRVAAVVPQLRGQDIRFGAAGRNQHGVAGAGDRVRRRAVGVQRQRRAAQDALGQVGHLVVLSVRKIARQFEAVGLATALGGDVRLGRSQQSVTRAGRKDGWQEAKEANGSR
ncbi:uncharacterized protein SPSK_01937 [Sporothrix schenckii 1099-18]|uniref:Uncharacterized protein n=1 Tax=Sporothrix schenckii 1099-18 TaxID=1397361 RepID=A0A0F2MD11_SPOSC|nr:uncharacterized protein SPSK_01937 [Sporothrix schenckii 1099-18]KJR87578.1 hypothetical protein SPSK_01937 [Sporothrix schenckii 1099-18]